MELPYGGNEAWSGLVAACADEHNHKVYVIAGEERERRVPWWHNLPPRTRARTRLEVITWTVHAVPLARRCLPSSLVVKLRALGRLFLYNIKSEIDRVV